MATRTMTAPRRSISEVVRHERMHGGYMDTTSLHAAAPQRSLSGRVAAPPSRFDPRRMSLNETSAHDRVAHMRRQSFHQKQSSGESTADLTAYYSFSRRTSSSVLMDEQEGLSGFLEYRKLDGSWRPFLFQTIGYQLVVFRVHVTHQVQVMSTDIRDATEIALIKDGGDKNNTCLFRLGVNNTIITLRAVSHHAAMYWVEGLERLRAGHLPQLIHDRPTIESEEDIFRQIDQMAHLRDWRPPPPVEPPFCGGFLPCIGRICPDDGGGDAPIAGFAISPRLTRSRAGSQPMQQVSRGRIVS